MTLQKLTLALTTGAVLAACSIANAKPDVKDDYTIYVYEDCKQVKQIAMTAEQIQAYKALKQQEDSMRGLELPIKEMEKKLAVHEKELDQLSGEMVIEEDDRVIVNRALIRQHEDIAEKMERVVKLHETDIRKLELQAQEIEAVASQFEKLIKPSLSGYTDKSIHVSIGKHNKNWRCEA